MRLLQRMIGVALLLGASGSGVLGVEPKGKPTTFPRVEPVVVAKTSLYRTHPAPQVQVRGWVTFLSGAMGVGVLHDETGGLLFHTKGMRSGGVDVRPGSGVELTGVMAQVGGMWMLVGSRALPGNWMSPDVKMCQLDGLVLPRAAIVNLAHLGDRAEMLSRVRTEGTLRRILAGSSNEPYRLEVSSTAGHVMVRLPRTVPLDTLQGAINRRVRMIGVAMNRGHAPWVDEQTDGTLLIPHAAFFQILPEGEWAAGTVPSLAALAEMSDEGTDGLRVKVDGVVSGLRAGEAFFLRVTDGVLEVKSRQASGLECGVKGVVVGTLRMRGSRPVLHDGTLHPLGSDLVLKPRVIDETPLAPDRLHGDWVEASGIVRDVVVLGSQIRIRVEAKAGYRFTVQTVDMPGRAGGPTNLPVVGSEVRAVGTCLTDESGLHRWDGAVFAVEVGGEEGLTVIKAAPWWTPQRTRTALWASFCALALLGTGALGMRRTLVRERGRLSRLERLQGVDQERRRIARELHDSLQAELATAALQLEALDAEVVLLDREQKALLLDAQMLLRRCQTEARNCIWNLRSLDDERSLGEVLGAWLRQRGMESPGVRLRLDAEEPLPDLEEDQLFEVMRIVQESVQNALKHAEPTSVDITLRSDGAEGLEVVVCDDGKGFDPLQVSNETDGHFGLSIVRERAQRIHARVDVRSHIAKGTRVRLLVPASPLGGGPT